MRRSPLPTPPQTYDDSRTYASVSGNLTGQDFVAILLGDVSGNWNPATHPRPAPGPERSTIVELPQMMISTGNEIVIPVNVQGVADKAVISYEFDLRYDPSVIKPQIEPVDVKGTVSRGLVVVTNAYEPGLLRVVVYGVYPIDADGILLNLRFAAVGQAGSVSPLAIERIMFNEGDGRTMVTDGQIVISK